MAVERFPVEEGSILQFARAVGDPNPIYADPDYAARTPLGGIIAPPTYAAASAHFNPDWPLRPRPGQPWMGSGAAPTGRPTGGGGGGGGTGLHAEQEFVYHRPLRPGDILSAETKPGDQWEKEGRSGRLKFSESVTEYRDQHGELVLTARSVTVLTEGPSGKGAGT